MKTVITTLITISIISIASLVFSQGYNTNDIPSIVTESMEEAVATGSLLSALDIWHREGHLVKFKGDANYLRNVNGINKFEQESYGRAISYEHLLITFPINEIMQIYTVLKYKNGAFFIKLNCQLINGEWDIKQYEFNTDPSKILPDSFYN